MTTVRGRSTLRALAAAFRACCLYALFLLVGAPALAGSVNLAWDPPTGPAPAGYMVYYGPSAGSYPSKIDVGNATTFTVTGLAEGTTYHFAATDYDASRVESGFSNDVAATVPVTTPVASFTAGTTSGTAPLTVSFTNSSTGSITSYSWNFGDGTSSTVASPSHVYSAAGVYTVSLTVSGSSGSNTQTRTSYITVTAPTPAPVAQFTGSPVSGTSPLNVSFTNGSTGSITSYAWNFGDGTSSTATSPSHVYSTAGVFTVSLTATGPGGSNTQTRTSYVTVTAPTPAPVASFIGSPTSGVAPVTVTFTNQSVGSITGSAWDFGDGTTSTAVNPVHVYSAAGTYTVKLTVTGPGGSNTQTRTSYVTVTAPTPAPVASFFGSPTSGVAPVTVTFTNQSVGSITGSAWDFGDGTASTAVNPVHVYSAAGTYTVKLTVTGPGGTNTQTLANYVTVTAPTPAPVASFFGSPTSGVAPVTVSFTNQSVGSITGSAWDFGDGTTSTAVNPVHVYSAAGTYTVKLTVTGPGGSNTQTRTSYVTVTSPTPAPVAQFTGTPVSGTSPLTVNFANASTGSITGYAWNFGDGTSSTAASPSHVYSSAGSYTVSLTVTGPGGSNTQSLANYVTVTSPTPAPVAQFTGTPVSGTSPLTVNFANASTGSITGYSWNFGDGTSSTVASPSHAYSSAGSYTVSLTVTGPGGSNTQTIVSYVTVTGGSSTKPAAQFNGTNVTGLSPLKVDFASSSTGNITNYSWDFGDGKSSSQSNPSHTYPKSGLYTVSLTVAGPDGSSTQTMSNLVKVAMPIGAAANYQGLWWNAPANSESGWGINLAHQDDTIFATWFTYDTTGRGWWLVMTAQKTAPDVYSGTLYQTRGLPFSVQSFDPAKVSAIEVGTGTLSFSGPGDGTFSYSITNVTPNIVQTKHITREVFGPQPVCTFGGQPDLSMATNFQDLWWAAPAASESGWGINLNHQGDTIFATWFTYDLDGTPLWLVVSAPKSGPGLYAGDLYRTSGPRLDAFDPSKVVATKVGTATFAFADGNTATFAYTITGIGPNVVTRSKTITREVFAAPGTACQ